MLDEAEAIRVGRNILEQWKRFDHDRVLLNDALLLATENLIIPVRFDYVTPHHRQAAPFRIAEFYTGLRGQKRIKLVDDVGRVWHYDYDEAIWLGVTRDG